MKNKTIQSTDDVSPRLRRHTKYCREWLASNGEFVRSKGESGILQSLNDGDVSAVSLLPIDLQSIAIFYGMRGTIGVIDGNSESWMDIDRAAAYHFWRIRVASRCTYMRLKAGQNADSIRLYHELPVAASLFCYAVFHGLREWQKEIWTLLTQAISTVGAISASYWRDQGAFELFVLRCFAGTEFASGEITWPDDLRKHDIGPFKDAINHWNHPSDFPQALQQICDYHCRNLMQRSSRDPWPPFTESPFDLVPCEVLAICRLRDALGLPTQRIDHPLMRTPLAQFERPFYAPYSDNTLKRVAELYAAQVSI